MEEDRARPDFHPTGGDWLSVVEPRLRPPLFSRRARARLRALASSLPGDSLAALEVRLTPPSDVVDLSLRLTTARQARWMADRLAHRRLRTFLLHWADGGALARVSSLWLEFDLDRDPDALPTPAVCAKLPHELDLEWLLETLLPALQGRRLSSLQRGVVRRCCGALPASGSLLYVFNMLSRGEGRLRLELFGLSSDEILDYLRRLVPTAAPAAIGIAPLFAGAERLHLSFDITTEILPRIGIEGSFARLPEREPRWRKLFARLLESGLCSASQRDALLSWSGYDSLWTAPSRWPAARTAIRGVCARSLSHLKAVCAPGRPPELKAYLLFGFRQPSGGERRSPPPGSERRSPPPADHD